jgi:hypothetical protein
MNGRSGEFCMLRKTIAVVPTILLALAGCTTSNDRPVTSEQGGPTIGAPAAPSAGATTPAACPSAPARAYAKTRFAANAGLAAGAFKRYIYTSHKEGRFKAGTPGHKTAVVKAAAAGLFATDQLHRARANAQADPALCRALGGPLDKLTATVSGLAGKLKRGQVDANDIAAVSGGLDGFRRTAGSAGAGFKAKDVPAGMIGA